MGVKEIVKFVMNKKYRFKQDFLDTAFGKIPQGMTATFVSTIDGSCRFKLPNGKNVGIPQKSALNLMEDC